MSSHILTESLFNNRIVIGTPLQPNADLSKIEGIISLNDIFG